MGLLQPYLHIIHRKRARLNRRYFSWLKTRIGFKCWTCNILQLFSSSASRFITDGERWVSDVPHESSSSVGLNGSSNISACHLIPSRYSWPAFVHGWDVERKLRPAWETCSTWLTILPTPFTAIWGSSSAQRLQLQHCNSALLVEQVLVQAVQVA